MPRPLRGLGHLHVGTLKGVGRNRQQTVIDTYVKVNRAAAPVDAPAATQQPHGPANPASRVPGMPRPTMLCPAISLIYSLVGILRYDSTRSGTALRTNPAGG
jgi:hypothetical protein